jgi:hypothetical protein
MRILGLIISEPGFSLTPVVEARLSKGYATITHVEKKCF